MYFSSGSRKQIPHRHAFQIQLGARIDNMKGECNVRRINKELKWSALLGRVTTHTQPQQAIRPNEQSGKETANHYQKGTDKKRDKVIQTDAVRFER